ncbi:unnamed protein product [Sphacelaria rigidula]
MRISIQLLKDVVLEVRQREGPSSGIAFSNSFRSQPTALWIPTFFSLKDVLVHFQKFQAVYEFPARASYRPTRVYQHHSRTAARQLRNTDGGYGGLTRVTPCKRVSRAAKASRAQHRPLSYGNIVLPTTCWKSYPPGSLLPQNTRLWNPTTPASARLLCAPALKNTFSRINLRKMAQLPKLCL